ncbi:MAG: hypothetical protein E7335_07495 [Clostridiales bacterium]|nr:hypothetical protein [Clostridiales bacterium]
MNHVKVAARAAEWAIGKIGCSYSQAKRTADGIFDCSSLVARAYTAMGKCWKYGGTVPRSNQEVYDDDFELLWPATYQATIERLSDNIEGGIKKIQNKLDSILGTQDGC